jgi:hypothetical protein
MAGWALAARNVGRTVAIGVGIDRRAHGAPAPNATRDSGVAPVDPAVGGADGQVGYAGHDRLMDGKQLPAPLPVERTRPIPSFVLACSSEDFFGAALRGVGLSTLVMTRSYVAPEGYAVEAAVRALGTAAAPSAVREQVVRAYARWQRIPERQASRYFAP